MSINAHFAHPTTTVGDVVALIQAFVPHECWAVHPINERMNMIVIHVPGTEGHVELGYTLGRANDRPVLTLRHAGPHLASVLDLLAAIVGDDIDTEGGGQYSGIYARRRLLPEFCSNPLVIGQWPTGAAYDRAAAHDKRFA